MIQIRYDELKENQSFSKNKLYKISETMSVNFVEEQNDCKDIVELKYSLDEEQYGIFAHEYRNYNTEKSGGKAADILACMIDTTNKKIYTTVLDVKHNISAFSDNLYSDRAMLTAIKNVREFVSQIEAEILHKDSLFVFYKADDYNEYERVGIATSNFDENKFIDVANMLEHLINCEVSSKDLILLKLKNSLASYSNELNRVRLFAEKKIEIKKQIYNLDVFLLESQKDSSYYVLVDIKDFV